MLIRKKGGTLDFMGIKKFSNRYKTSGGLARAKVDLTSLKTLWFNTGSLCNITCANCYMDSSPRNDSLVYLSLSEVVKFLDELDHLGWGTVEIAFTGGEPFLNKDLPSMIMEALSRNYEVLVLSNGMKPMWNYRKELLILNERFGSKMTIRISMDHYSKEKHEAERGINTWTPMLAGLRWLSKNKINISIAGRSIWSEAEEVSRKGYEQLFKSEDLHINPWDKNSLVLFPEMRNDLDVPEISIGCWKQLGLSPRDVMCSTSRMIVKRKGDKTPVVVPCTLLPYQKEFELGTFLSQANVPIHLNHPNCASFCVLGGGACSSLK